MQFLLERVYTYLDLVGGALLDAADSPSTDDTASWNELGDWLLPADRVKAETMTSTWCFQRSHRVPMRTKSSIATGALGVLPHASEQKQRKV